MIPPPRNLVNGSLDFERKIVHILDSQSQLVGNLVGNILKLKDRTPNSGIDNTTLGTDSLDDREFDCDPLYRLLKATGRESQTQDSTTLWDNSPKTSTPTPQNVRSYTRKYWYDKMGHMEKLKNEASNNNFTRYFNLIAGTNQVDKLVDRYGPGISFEVPYILS